jgi:hypothetical protein
MEGQYGHQEVWGMPHTSAYGLLSMIITLVVFLCKEVIDRVVYDIFTTMKGILPNAINWCPSVASISFAK